MAARISDLNPITIRFQSKEEAVKGFYVLMTSGMPVHTTKDEKYIINEVQCTLLTNKGIQFIRE